MRRLFFGLFFCFGYLSGLEQNVYRPVGVPDEAYFAESFDAGALDRVWVLSKAVKEDQQKLHIYDGKWALEESVQSQFLGNKGLVLKSPGKHHAISANLHRVFHFNDKPLILQYEVFFQSGINCGGAYIKLLSDSDDIRLSQFSNATPYTIMFGPDKCGRSYKIHFIFSLLNPMTGKYEEKHARQPEVDLSDYFTDQQPHVYTLYLFPDNSFEIYVDLTLINAGSLLEVLNSQPNEKKKHFFTEDEVQTSDFWEHQRSEDLEDQSDNCIGSSDCQGSSGPGLKSPAFKNPKSPPSKSPTDKASRGEHAVTLSPIVAVGFELLSMTGDVVFDNILLCDNLEVARRWTEDTWGQRKKLGLIEKLLAATVKRPWLWGVYVFTVGLPVILFISLMWPDKRFGPPDQDYYYKKTDDPQKDGPKDNREYDIHQDGVTPSIAGGESRAVKRKVRPAEGTS